ncbi:hypothetical protein COCMIDRAFT_97546 [Bipolaris oryzae ATCC 44560]|uniref:Uncharacterized protein n=1 Tax=Bipolaris oryzae ATCC 44560 TaxID=930090 RepID=W6ZB51_COCMI|nr:uncharacterized protein COCMIDRAFT_97546 [Bipolaris oryzae ATCC 44560]EUC44674.1 hypothetical protein COCMIDRAFT_97546 [Bipolaris oryzae ATCC 44560]
MKQQPHNWPSVIVPILPCLNLAQSSNPVSLTWPVLRHMFQPFAVGSYPKSYQKLHGAMIIMSTPSCTG